MSALSATSKRCFEQPAASFLVCSLIFIEYKSGTKMSDQDSKILVELGRYLKIKKPHFARAQGVVVFYLLDQVLFIKRSRIG